MLHDSLFTIIFSYCIALLWTVWQICTRRRNTTQYYLLLILFSIALLIQSTISVQLLQKAFVEQFFGFIISLHLVLWAVCITLTIFSVFVITYSLLAIALITAIAAYATLWLFGNEIVHVTKSFNTNDINWHSISAIVTTVFLLITTVCAFFIRRVERKLKHAYLMESDMIMTLPLSSMQSILRAFAWVSWGLMSVALITGYWFTHSFLEQQLLHKFIFTLVAWTTLSIFLFINHTHWLPTATNNRFLYISALSALIGYFGTRIAIEYLLT